MPVPRIKYQKKKITISSNGASGDLGMTTEKGYQMCTAIAIFTTDTDAFKKSYFSKAVRLAGQEIFCQDFEPKVIFCGNNVPVPERWYELNPPLPADGQMFEATYLDGSSGTTPYDVTLYLRLENPPLNEKKPEQAEKGATGNA